MNTTNVSAGTAAKIPVDWEERAVTAAQEAWSRNPGSVTGARAAALRSLPMCDPTSVVLAAISVVGYVALDRTADGRHWPFELVDAAELKLRYERAHIVKWPLKARRGR